MTTESHENDIIQEISNEFSKPNLNTPLVDLSTTYAEPQFTIAIDGVKALPLGDLVAVSAKAKQGKSTLCSIIASAVLSGECCAIKGILSIPKLLYFDTEQHVRNSARLAKRIHRLCGWDTTKNDPRFKCYSLRTFTSAERITFIENTSKEEHPNFVFVDGVRDLIEDFNDISQSSDCINRLMKLSAELNACIVCILHQNKARDNTAMRGHLGSELLNKCADVLEVKRNEKVFCVSTSDSRNEPLPDWTFTLDEDAMPVPYDGQTYAADVKVSKIKDALTFCLSKESLPYARLVEGYAVAYGCSERTAKRHIALALQNRFLHQNDKGEYCILVSL